MLESCNSSSHASLRSFDAQNKHDDKVAKLLPVRFAATVLVVVVVAGVSVATLLYSAAKKIGEQKADNNMAAQTVANVAFACMARRSQWPLTLSPAPPLLTRSHAQLVAQVNVAAI